MSFYKNIFIRNLQIIMEDTIFLKDVLSTMNTLNSDGFAVPFSIKVRTYNRYSKTGGKLNHYPKAKLVMKEGAAKYDEITALRTKPKAPVARKKPYHFANKTRNIKILPSGKIKKIHIRFIIEFNGKKVIY